MWPSVKALGKDQLNKRRLQPLSSVGGSQRNSRTVSGVCNQSFQLHEPVAIPESDAATKTRSVRAAQYPGVVSTQGVSPQRLFAMSNAISCLRRTNSARSTLVTV